MQKIRLVEPQDVQDLKSILDSIELFPSEMLDDMIEDYFNNPESSDIWFTMLNDEKPISIGYCVPEKLTEGTFNLLAIGVRSDTQGSGIGRKMMYFIEQYLKERGHRLLIVDTSSTPEFEQTRKFYHNLGYKKEAIIKDFWDEGDDKVIFSKKINVADSPEK